MVVETEKVLALKAFYMGHAIAEKHSSKAIALAMIGAAISHLQNATDVPGKVRLAFYHMLRAEILRHETTPLNDGVKRSEYVTKLIAHFMIILWLSRTLRRAERS